jgi:hypothetical protein
MITVRRNPFLKGAVGALLVLLGSALALVSFSGVLDPISFQQANDTDPFGPPLSRLAFGVLVTIGLGLTCGGAVVLLAALFRPGAAPGKEVA